MELVDLPDYKYQDAAVLIEAQFSEEGHESWGKKQKICESLIPG